MDSGPIAPCGHANGTIGPLLKITTLVALWHTPFPVNKHVNHGLHHEHELLQSAIAKGDDPGVVADVVLQAASAAHPKLRYAAGAVAGRLRFLRRFAPAGLLDAGIRRDLRLDVQTVAPVHSSAVAK